MAVYLGISITPNSQSIANNTSNVTVRVNCSWTGGSYNKQTTNGVPNAGGWVTIDGTYYYFNSTFNDDRTSSGSKTLYTKTLDIKHGTDGTKTLTCRSEFDTRISSGVISATNSLELTDIPRFATIESAPNFNDEENPTITYSNPAGTSIESLRACISLDGTNADIEYRDISKTGTSYTFNLTDAERNVLRNATTGGNTRTVKFYVRSEIGGSHEGSNLARTFTIKNPNPTINPTITDTNSTTVALTGSSSKLVKYYSNAAITIGAAAVKGASLTSQKVTCGGKSLTANGTINAVESGSFVFTAKDNRGNTTTKTVTPSFVNYVKVTCGLGNNMPSADGSMTVKASGNYFNGSFGSKSNSLKVYYRYKTAGGSYGSWAAMTVTLNGNAYSATANLTGLDYQTNYIFQAYAVDALATVYSTEQSVKAEPVFDWGQGDFNFNVPVHAPSLTLDTPLTIESGGTGVKLSGLNQDYGYTVYPLCQISTTASTHLESGTQGIFYFKRANGLDAPKFLMVQAENQYSGANRFNISTMGEITYNASMTAASGLGFRTCRFQMGSVWYGGIAMAISNANFARVSFVGTSVANTVKGIDIYNRNTGTILNSEIYNSLVYDAGDFKNSLYRNTGTVGLEAYPVNSIYISYSHTSPAELFGGTWHRMESRFLWGTTTDGTIGATAGEMTHTLTVDEMPSHTHNNKLNGGSQTTASSVYDWVSNSKAWQWYNLATESTGGGAAHNNMPPYVNVAIWRRTA